MNIVNDRTPRRLLAAALLLASLLAARADPEPVWGRAPRNSYLPHNLVADEPGQADHTDRNLVNPWGLAFNPFGVVWVANNGTGTSTLYDGLGNPQSLVVTIPPAPGEQGPGNPTGIVFSGSPTAFVVTRGSASGPSRFIFASENGTLAGWAPNVDPTNAILAVDNSRSNAIYKGLALAGNGTGLFLYATDFHNRRIDVFDSQFQPVRRPGAFEDPSIPRDFAPFGIQNIQGDLFVTYAKQNEEGDDDVPGRGLGFINVFDADGHLLRRLASRGNLNAPWGLALAPSSFGIFRNRLLVGNFGDGAINVYDPGTGIWLGQLRRPNGSRLRIEGLWGLSFGNGLFNQPTGTLFFTAGPDDEEHGRYGRIEPAPSERNADLPEREDADE